MNGVIYEWPLKMASWLMQIEFATKNKKEKHVFHIIFLPKYKKIISWLMKINVANKHKHVFQMILPPYHKKHQSFKSDISYSVSKFQICFINKLGLIARKYFG